MARPVLRGARPGESDSVANLHAATATVAYAHIFPAQPFPLEATRQRWRHYRGRIIVADTGIGLAGFVAFDGEWLNALYVLPEYWDSGLGHRLLAAAGRPRLLWVLAANDRGRRFYERHGWRPDGVEREYLGAVELRYSRSPAPGPR